MGTFNDKHFTCRYIVRQSDAYPEFLQVPDILVHAIVRITRVLPGITFPLEG